MFLLNEVAAVATLIAIASVVSGLAEIIPKAGVPDLDRLNKRVMN